MNPSSPAPAAATVPRYVSAAELAELVDPAAAADALSRGLADRPPDRVDPVRRSIVSLARSSGPDPGDLMLMPSHGDEGAGVKLVTIRRGDRTGPPQPDAPPTIQGIYVLFAQDSLSPELIIDGAGLTRLRTAAVSAVATRRLAREDSSHLVVFGGGVQADAHVAAMRAARPIERVSVVGATPTSARALALVNRLRAQGVDARLGSPECVRSADIVCTCTTATQPIFEDRDVPDGAHINAVGSYRTTMRELPSSLLARCLLVVESEDHALAEAGEIVLAISEGVLPATGFAADLGSLLRGEINRTSAQQVTVFKSVGMAIEDLILARALADQLAAPPSTNRSIVAEMPPPQ